MRSEATQLANILLLANAGSWWCPVPCLMHGFVNDNTLLILSRCDIQLQRVLSAACAWRRAKQGCAFWAWCGETGGCDMVVGGRFSYQGCQLKKPARPLSQLATRSLCQRQGSTAFVSGEVIWTQRSAGTMHCFFTLWVWVQGDSEGVKHDTLMCCRLCIICVIPVVSVRVEGRIFLTCLSRI